MKSQIVQTLRFGIILVPAIFEIVLSIAWEISPGKKKIEIERCLLFRITALLATLILCISSISFAQSEDSLNCGPLAIDIKAKLPPVRNQQGAAWCSLFTFSDLLSARYGRAISASYLGSMLSPTGGMGVNSDMIRDLVKKVGLCFESTMPSNRLPRSYSSFLREFESAAKNYAIDGSPLKPHHEIFLRTTFPSLNESAVSTILRNATNQDGSVRSLEIRISHRAGHPSVNMTYLGHLALATCMQDRALTAGAEIRTIEDYVEYFNGPIKSSQKLVMINDILERGQPVGIGYDFAKMTNRLNDPAWTNTREHESSIVDRRFINGRCQYLVRNSWGTSTICQQLIPEADGCSTPGHFWVSAEHLARHIILIHHIE